MQPPSTREGDQRQAGHERQHEHQPGGDEQGPRIGAELAEDRLLGRAARAALGDEKAGRERDDERRDLRDQAVADREPGEDVGRLRRAACRGASRR